jgi:hypothetical protein
LALNLAGSVLLFLSFQATSSNVKIVTTKDGRTALCVDGRGLIESGARGFGVGMSKCPDWENAKPAAVVNIEYPFMVTLGFSLTLAGFLIQYLSVPDPRTIDALRAEITTLKKRRKK